MTPDVGDVMREARNYFQQSSVSGAWRIAGGRLLPDAGLPAEGWIAITGSGLCDGVYRLGEGQRLTGAADAAFTGEIWQLAPPAAFLALCEQIAAWCAVQPEGTVRREQFGGYSRELAAAPDGGPLTWQHRFARALTPYRRMYPGVRL